MALLVTCDTGGDHTPAPLRARLADVGLDTAPRVDETSDEILAVPPIDSAALLAAHEIARHAGCECIANPNRSDLVDVGRSKHHRGLFRPEIRALPVDLRMAILREIRTPYRRAVRRRISDMLLQFPYVIHLSVRTFDARTPAGDWRRGDVGLLYDPASQDEVDWCLDLSDELWNAQPNLKIRRNHPGRGTNDSLTKSMRKHFEELHYLGIEVVLNRSWAARPIGHRHDVFRGLGQAIRDVTPEAVPQAA